MPDYKLTEAIGINWLISGDMSEFIALIIQGLIIRDMFENISW